MQLSKKHIRIVAVLMAGAFFVVLNQTLLSPAMPTIMVDLEVDAATVQWLTSGYALVEAIIIPLNAYLLGRIGARRIFVFGMTLFAAGSVVCGIAPTFGILMAGRVMQACATAAMMPATFTVILLIFPKERRGAAMGIVGLVISVAPAIGPVVSGVLVDTIGWRYEFALITVCACALAVVCFFALKGMESFVTIGFDALSVILLAAGMVPLLFGLSTLASAESALIPAVLIACGVAVLALFAYRQLKLPSPILKISTLKIKRFAMSLAVITFLEALIIAGSVVFPIFAQNALGFSATVAGLCMMPGVLVGMAVGILSGRHYDRHGARGISILGCVFLIAGYASYLALGMGASAPVIALAYAIPTFGINCLINPINTWGLNALENRDLAHGNAIISTMEQVGASLGTGLIVGLTALGESMAGNGASAAKQAFAGCRISFFALLVIAVVITAVVLVFVRDRKKTASNEDR